MEIIKKKQNTTKVLWNKRTLSYYFFFPFSNLLFLWFQPPYLKVFGGSSDG